MFNSFVRFFGETASRRKILVEAILNTSLAWVMIRLLPYSLWRHRLGVPYPLALVGTPEPTAHFGSNRELDDISWAFAALDRRLNPFFTCLMFGFSARAMLRRRGYETILVLGAAKKGNGDALRLGAHAWVTHKGVDIVGGEVRHKYAPVAAFEAKNNKRYAATTTNQ